MKDEKRPTLDSSFILHPSSFRRITAADFLTPPELADWSLAEEAAGRVGGVRLELVAGPAGTSLGACYQQVPLRVLPPFRLGRARPGLLYLLNPTAGLMDGDGQLVEVTARPGAQALLVGQSATRIHPALHGFSTQQWRLRVEEGAVLVVLPGPTIPFQGCRYFQSLEVDLEPGAGFVWGEIWLPGRYARGVESERFRFDRFVQQVVIRRAGRLVFRDRSCWRGPWGEAEAAWHFGGAVACGSVFATGDSLDREGHGERVALSRTAGGDGCLRCCGEAEEVIGRVVRAGLNAGAVLAGSAGEWLPRDAIAPAHWFSPGWAGSPGGEDSPRA
jgi:urease accessory protein